MPDMNNHNITDLTSRDAMKPQIPKVEITLLRQVLHDSVPVYLCRHVHCYHL